MTGDVPTSPTGTASMGHLILARLGVVVTAATHRLGPPISTLMASAGLLGD